MTNRIVGFGLALLARWLLGVRKIQAQTLDPCDQRPDAQIFREPLETSHGVDQTLVDILHALGHLLLFGWWLFAAGLLAFIVRAARRSKLVWVLLGLPLVLVLWVALPPLQELHQRLADLQAFYLQCRATEPPSHALLDYKQRQWEHASPYILMLLATALLYGWAISHLIRFQRNPPTR